MKEFDEFKQIGKETPYQAPAGFFETISEKTLQKAILREKNQRKNNLRRLILSVAASVVFLLYLGILFIGKSDRNSMTNLIVQDSLPIVDPSIHKMLGTTEKNKDLASKKINSEKKSGEKLADQLKYEVLDDVLSDLNDDELQQIAAMYKSDLFISESLQ